MVQVLLVLVAASVSVTWALSSSPNTFIILGGTGRIGTAVATHLLQQQPCAKIILAGRNAERGKRAVQEVLDECNDDAQVEWKQLADVWDESALTPLVVLGNNRRSHDNAWMDRLMEHHPWNIAGCKNMTSSRSVD